MGKTMEDTEDEQDILFRQMIKRNSKIHYQCAEYIGKFVYNKWNKTLSEEDLIYLTIHLKRINMG